MDLFETTGFGFAQGNLYERMPMFRTGIQFGKGDFKFQPEFAIALASFGESDLRVTSQSFKPDSCFSFRCPARPESCLHR